MTVYQELCGYLQGEIDCALKLLDEPGETDGRISIQQVKKILQDALIKAKNVEIDEEHERQEAVVMFYLGLQELFDGCSEAEKEARRRNSIRYKLKEWIKKRLKNGKRS